MKIVRRCKVLNQTIYQVLSVGDVFMLPNDENNFYLTLDEVDMAMKISDTSIIDITPDTKVIPVEAELHILSIGE